MSRSSMSPASSALDPESAEVAVAVIDGYQGLGVGKRLPTALGRRAVANGIALLTGDSLVDHDDVGHLPRSFGIEPDVTVDDSGTMRASIEFEGIDET